MWEINNSFQVFGFLSALILGGIFSLAYDFLRAIRKMGVNSILTVFFQDVFYFIIISPITFCFLLALTNGELRAYFFIALILGFVLIRITVSGIALKVFIIIISLLVKFYNLIFNVFNTFFNLIFEKFKLLYKFLKKISSKLKNVSKNS